MDDFIKDNERRGTVSKEILQTRYDFFHNKRFYKLGEISKLRE